MIKAKNIHKSFDALEVLKGVDIEIAKGEIVSIVGPSGAGKTTLLQILGTLDRPDAGDVEVNDVNFSKLNEKELAAFRNKHIGFIFQFHQLLPEFTALENVMIPALIARKDTKSVTARAKELIGYLGLSERMEHKPSELSGGEKQLVTLARMMLYPQPVAILDEPTANLDASTVEIILEQILKMSQERLVIVASHEDKFDAIATTVLQLNWGEQMN